MHDLVRYASDASPYRFIPQVVVLAEDIDDVAAVLRFARENGRNVVFRAAGTSLNGQAQGEDILVDVRRHFAGIEVLPDKHRARIRPGTTIMRANAVLVRHGRLMGPDPASAIACTVGGVVANNASGMTAGVTRNSYRLMESATVVLPSGTVVDTSDAEAETKLWQAEPELCAELMAIKAEIESDPALVRRIRAKYAIKNTNGYRVDAFLDGRNPVEILRGLMVGSQGTLGFIAETVFDTVPLNRLTSTALLFFDSLHAAAAAVPKLADAGASAVELMDGNTLRACAAVEGAPADWAELPKPAAALLVEFRAPDEKTLDLFESKAQALLVQFPLTVPVDSISNAFTRDKKQIRAYWKAREAFISAVGKARPPGSTLITEDFAVSPAHLADACDALLELQERHGFDAAVTGHAAHGNLHFLLAFDSAKPDDVSRYDAFMQEFCSMAVERFDGSLKAEHGTGRNIAPFLELEWGSEVTALMWRVKQAFDPHGVLGRGVILDRDPQAHLRGLKSIPHIEDIGNPCIECGFCEPVCPSRDVTTTPRQRIALRREMYRQEPGAAVTEQLVDAYGYHGVDTCAGDSTCKIACPVGIDTGAMMKDFRRLRHSETAERVAKSVADRFGTVERLLRLALQFTSWIDDRLLGWTTRTLRRGAAAAELIPEWLPEIPRPAPVLPRTKADAAAVYFPACVNRIFAGPTPGDLPLPQTIVTLSERAGLPVTIPDDVSGKCCATIWHSKGYHEGNVRMANLMVESAYRWTGGGRLPLVVDATSCSLGITSEVVPYLTEENRRRHMSLRIVDSVTWAARELLPQLRVFRRLTSVVLHPTCSGQQLGNQPDLEAVAAAISELVTVPITAQCCGFAGDRGLLHRELTESATAAEAAEIGGQVYDAYLSTNRTCEMGMQHATGEQYRSVLTELEWATRP
ncbi:FAD-binding and (Fe-S)-binding domain-containing protein [Lentzea albidocapillata]|uniref:FAD-binding and (Fe-S)-binding domain-containing protein n=1 Tax=Lentzea albidocapillata TaxID=40571 RepID=UPI001B80D52E|nr:FAD-binding and (Fe-S)-binding domain-containing protein [Lentzea albidocapillata]